MHVRRVRRSGASAGSRGLPHHLAPHFTVEPFILTGYRPAYPRPLRHLWSSFELHTETANIWSHAAAALFFTAVVCADESITSALRACMCAHAFVYAVSTTAHTFGAVSERVSYVLFALDKSAISIMFMASGMCAASIEFGSRPALFVLVVSVMLVTCCACVSQLIQPKGTKWLNASTLGMQMLLAASPVAHLVLTGRSPGLAEHVMHMAARAIFPSFVGGLLYALRVPERLAPGWFDLLHSHSLMHVGTAAGSYFTYIGLAEWERAAHDAHACVNSLTSLPFGS
jgi:adiponectin receptor